MLDDYSFEKSLERPIPRDENPFEIDFFGINDDYYIDDHLFWGCKSINEYSEEISVKISVKKRKRSKLWK